MIQVSILLNVWNIARSLAGAWNRRKTALFLVCGGE